MGNPSGELLKLNLEKLAAPPEPKVIADDVDVDMDLLRTDMPDLEGPTESSEKPAGPVWRSNLMFNPNTHPIILFEHLTKIYGPIWLSWDPDALWIILKRDTKTDVLHITQEKINAVKTLLLVDTFWWDWEVFEKVVQALNNNVVRFDIIQPPTLGQMANALAISKELRPEMTQFDDEVLRYIAAVFAEEGVEYCPAPWNIAQKHVGPIPEDIRARYDALQTQDIGTVTFEETAPDIQALKLHAALAYHQFRVGQLEVQRKTLNL